MRITILQRYLSGWRGGVRVTMQLARCLASAGHDVTLLGRSPLRPASFYYSPPQRVRLLFWRASIQQSEANPEVAFLSECSEIRKSLPDSDLLIVSNCFDALAVTDVKIPRIYFVQGMESDFYQSAPYKQQLAERSYFQEFCFIAVSEYIRDELSHRYGAVCSEVIPPAVDEVFLAAGKIQGGQKHDIAVGPILVLYVGPVTIDKGFDDLTTALRILHLAGMKCALNVATQAPVRLERAGGLVASFNKPCNDLDLVDLYKNADVLVYPSHKEAFGLVPLEAMACGTPTVLSDSGGVSQYAQAGTNALVVPCSSPRDLADAIHKLTTDASLSEWLISNGVITAEQFTLPIMCSLWESAINKVMN
jgi:glycosyltransferase involved in cell wall biosynthesis